MRKLPDRCIDFCMTSPPYWSMRDYGVKGQLGLEKTPEEYIEKLVIIFRELKRILKATGSFYLNLGDTYIGSACRYKQKGQVKNTIAKTPPGYISNKQKSPSFVSVDKNTWKKPKQLALIPSRVAIALLCDGWILRNDICWYKPNAMPSSVKDRLTNHWEHIFHFVKQRRYYYDLDAIREPHKTASLPFNYRVRLAQQGRSKNYMIRASPYETEVAYKMGIRKNKQYQYKGTPQNSIKSLNIKIKNSESVLDWREKARKRGQLFDKPVNNQGGGQTGLRRYRGYKTKEGSPYDHSGRCLDQHHGASIVYSEKGKNPGDVINVNQVMHKSLLPNPEYPRAHFYTGNLNNPGDFWSITTKLFPSAHFAVYPEEICIKPILSSCPQWICKKCGLPRVRMINKEIIYRKRPNKHVKYVNGGPCGHPDQTKAGIKVSTIGWTDCGCNAGWEPGIVFDPFAGSATTLVMAKKLGRRFIGCDINPEYVKLARKRLKTTDESSLCKS
ncbi:MAG: site-specific DNA-methyltransferase [Candidatus Helarchaeota archaeon]|nr:site-specific DNA-methyltransferase [Candidatus Helarchaeota archaeon]